MVSLSLSLLALLLVVEAVGRGRRVLWGAPLLPLLGLLGWRGWQVGFLPLSNKYESFLGFATCLLGVALWRHARLGRPARLLLGVLALGFLAQASQWDDALHYPSPLLYTVWYLLHVPCSMVGYALWLAAAGHGLDHLLRRTQAEAFGERLQDDLRAGLMWFSAAMIFGGVWGVVSWGVWFLWDPKIVWSVLSWLYFATLAHLRYWPVPPGRGVALLALLGVLVVGITYVGTSFMTGSIHAF